ncbi:DUF429 domain-containing protein [Haliangium ochraceum]|uniref:DUF429 domain-containing protein n=1 Tax=Haliangium ochraceum (strain DSM 14365 / JCM 11303 / SMP-2) TaxID=502025 RepID=D0LYP8_HALO1|nr:DUF429 domain-containing protein [Haliangium ochraceum]ACY17914.1 hypothetical protein Hoch_5431 [Haliangium ochraceum DSM 14365]
MERPFSTFIGIDLGGARGKTTAVAKLALAPRGETGVAVQEVQTRHNGVEPWHDAVLVSYLREQPSRAALAINAPLTVPACVRCVLAECPGKETCAVPAVQWLYSEGQALAEEAFASDYDRIAAIPSASAYHGFSSGRALKTKPRVEPYLHRAAEVALHYQRGVLPRDALGLGTGPIAARGVHLRRLLASHGYTLHEDLLEVSSRATVHALFDADKARGYKRDADPWQTRADIVEQLGDLYFAPSSRLSKEEVLRNDHCFEALLSAYTAYLWARDGWRLPPGVFDDDGWIWVPPERA